jgi:AmmeMemoRadiSam system protein B
MNIRPPAVSGSFYPSNPTALREMLMGFFDQSKSTPVKNLKALIVPHAGYVYSGAVAAVAYQSLIGTSFKNIVLLGPAHRVWIPGIALSTADVFRTPLGDVPLHTEWAQQLSKKFDYVVFNDEAHQEEHALEVQFPFLQLCLSGFKVLPLVVGDASAEQVADVLEMLHKEALIIISSDLSHYLTYLQCQKTDIQTIQDILYFKTTLQGEQACGCHPLNGFLAFAHKHALQLTCVKSCNSGDTAGDKNKVVGYAAFIATFI